MSEEKKLKWIGTRPIRHDGVDKVTGKANFGADLNWPGTLCGKILRSPHAHARIVRIDTSAAEAIDGVAVVVTGKDFPDPPTGAGAGEGPQDFRDMARNVMARDKVLYNGHALAAVAAKTPRIAELALQAIEVEYEVLEPVLNLERALADDAPILHEDMRAKGDDPLPEGPTNIANHSFMGFGDVDEGFANADHIVEREFTTETVHQGYIEPHAVIARSIADGRAEVYCSTQGHFMVRAYSAKVLDMDPTQIKVVPAEIGGGFGGKTVVYAEPVAILLAKKTGRPVKIVMSRDEVFRATGPTSGSHIRVKIGVKKDGTITAADATLTYEAGAFKGSPVAPGMMTIFAPYKLEHVRIEGFDVVVNKPKVAAYRAPGAPMAAFASETVIDEIASDLGMDPIDFRLKNAATEGDQAAYGPKFKVHGFTDTLEAAKNHPHYKAPLGPNQGRGVASGFWFNAGMQSSASVMLNEDGNAIVVSGNPDIGGSRASMALMAAEELGIPVDQIRPVVGDTESVGYSDLTGGSRVTFATGMAVVEASRDVVRQLCERAAKIWEIDVQDVEWREGAAIAVNGSSGRDPLTITELAASAAKTGGPIQGRASLNARGPGPGFATHICDVEVDKETGRVDVVRYTAIQDVGRAIHPSYVEGQMQGGAVQGIGWALNEAYVYDADGQLENPGFLDYRMPVASDLPMIDTVIIEVPNPTHPYGVRGVGEVPIVPPLPAVANAVHNATGVRFRSLPISPPRVLEALDD